MVIGMSACFITATRRLAFLQPLSNCSATFDRRSLGVALSDALLALSLFERDAELLNEGIGCGSIFGLISAFMVLDSVEWVWWSLFVSWFVLRIWLRFSGMVAFWSLALPLCVN